MAEIVTMPDGRNEVLAGFDGFIDLADRYMGMEARMWIEEHLEDHYIPAKELEDAGDRHEKDMEELHEHYRGILREAREMCGDLEGMLPDGRAKRLTAEIRRMLWENT